MSWHDAKAFCERQGGQLVTIASKEENEFVTGLARRLGQPIWIGLADERREGRWKWVTGEPLVFEAFHDEGMSRNLNELYTKLLPRRSQWFDDLPGKGFAFVCEWEAAATGARRAAARPSGTARRGTALLVSGALPPGPGDGAVRDRLEALGYSASMKVPEELVSSDTEGVALVLVSSTIESRKLGAKLRDAPVPVLCWENAAFDDMGMTGRSESGVAQGQGRLLIVDRRHPLAAGLSGTVAVSVVTSGSSAPLTLPSSATPAPGRRSSRTLPGTPIRGSR